jgi:hypothetical protein
MKLPKVKPLRKLLYWMEERQRIYLQRAAGERYPWTADPILQRYRFCNTYREQDRETVWLRENWREPHADHPNLWFAICMFRQINWSPTLAEIGFPERWEPKTVLKALTARKARGEKIYTSAYLIPSHGEKEKIRYTVNLVLAPLWKTVQRARLSRKQEKLPPWEATNATLQDSHEWLMGCFGFGPFLSYEVVTDLRHTHYLKNAQDTMTWANPGPGARRGLNRLYGRDLKQTVPREQLLEEMRGVLAWLKTERDSAILPALEMRDVEHSLCEFDKYLRASERLNALQNIGLERFAPSRSLL